MVRTQVLSRYKVIVSQPVVATADQAVEYALRECGYRGRNPAKVHKGRIAKVKTFVANGLRTWHVYVWAR